VRSVLSDFKVLKIRCNPIKFVLTKVLSVDAQISATVTADGNDHELWLLNSFPDFLSFPYVYFHDFLPPVCHRDTEYTTWFISPIMSFHYINMMGII